MRLGRAPRRRGGHRRWRQARRRWERLHVTHYRATRRPICHCALYGCRHGPSTAARTHGPLWVWCRAAPLLESRQPGPLLCAYIRYGKLGRACQRSTYLLLHIYMHACSEMQKYEHRSLLSVRYFFLRRPHATRSGWTSAGVNRHCFTVRIAIGVFIECVWEQVIKANK